MTLLISWVGVDDKKEGKSVASIYIASDSRYTWKKGGVFNSGIKVFGSTRYPEIFGFCGDVQFPSTILLQLIGQIDSGVFIQESDDWYVKSNKIFNFIKGSVVEYPKEELVGGFTILYATRFEKDFRCFKISYDNSNALLVNSIVDIPEISTKIFSGGSGSTEFESNWSKWDSVKHNNYRTSRAVYHCLSSTLKNIKDPSTGGLPQIVGLYRNNNARFFGVVDEHKMYVYGKELLKGLNPSSIEWRNENFERIDPQTSKIFEEAQRQPL